MTVNPVAGVAAVGVPEITPAGDRFRPAGGTPVPGVKVIVPVPPDAVIV
jgi:hypothetical protein